jgi:leucyl-tRNA synthetase
MALAGVDADGEAPGGGAASAGPGRSDSGDRAADRDLRRATHQTIKRVTDDMEAFGFNTAVAALMEFRNTLKRHAADGVGAEAWSEAVDSLLLLMAPLTPHIAEELWQRRGHPYSIHRADWPTFDPDIAAEEKVELAVQVGGKVKDRILVAIDVSEDEAVKMALASEAIQRSLAGAEPKRVIYVAGRLVNIVV